MPVVATAGHVDHGKSTLIVALTGRDPDRWEEEKRRGLTIDLGFAWTTLPSGREIGFVDVPGHERFIKNMLAGIDAVDAVLFVVAADEGWMPQSEEHLAVVDLLGIRSGVVALTRSDLADDETLELAELEVRERLEGTALEDAPVIRVAAPAGTGVEGIRNALDGALPDPGGPGGDRPRLWVDRSFSISGAGTVVTGTLTGGPLAAGDGLMLWPGDTRVRVRGLQSHERTVPEVEAGTRVALNLAGVDRRRIPRGAMLGRPGQWRTTRRLAARVLPVRSLAEPLRDRGAYHLHAGSGAWRVEIRFLESPSPGEPGPALVTLDEALPLASGDRFVLRDVGRRAVVAGGTVLDPRPPRRGADIAAGLSGFPPAPSPDDSAEILLSIRGREEAAWLEADSRGGRPANGILVDGTFVSPGEADRIVGAATRLLDRFHAEFPLRPGMPKPDLAGRLGIDLGLLEGLAAGASEIADDGATMRSAGHGADLDPAARESWEAARAVLAAAGRAAPRVEDLDLDPELLHALVRRGEVIQVSEEFAYLPETITEITEVVRGLADGFTVAGFRDAAGITRRHAVPLLEWMDDAGITVRRGDRRRVRPSPPGGPASGGAPSR